jgi:signal transduction histidine kinase
VVREEERPTWIRGDPDLLHQVLVNLVLNAVQALEQQESRLLTVRLGRRADGDGGKSVAVLEVEDSGPGIPPEVIGSIFEPFFTTKPRGTGLGLVVASTIVAAHAGQIEVTTGARGSVFRLVLPMTEELEAANA